MEQTTTGTLEDIEEIIQKYEETDATDQRLYIRGHLSLEAAYKIAACDRISTIDSGKDIMADALEILTNSETITEIINVGVLSANDIERIFIDKKCIIEILTFGRCLRESRAWQLLANVPTLRFVGMYEIESTSEGLKFLFDSPYIEELMLCGELTTLNADVYQVLENNTILKKIEFSMVELDFNLLLRYCTNLKELTLIGCKHVPGYDSDRSQQLLPLTNLRTLILEDEINLEEDEGSIRNCLLQTMETLEQLTLDIDYEDIKEYFPDFYSYCKQLKRLSKLKWR